MPAVPKLLVIAGLSVGGFAVSKLAAEDDGSAHWYSGLKSVLVFGPEDNPGAAIQSLYQKQFSNQFGAERYAVLLKSGDYGDLDVGVGYYTSVAGVGVSRKDVKVRSFHSDDQGGSTGGATQNFWRSVEGLTTSASSTWATSQACPLRRLSVNGDLHLSQAGYSSGGFMADVTVNGTWKAGTQQQYCTRNARLASVERPGAFNFVYIGVDGAPAPEAGKISIQQDTPSIAEKPYLVEKDGEWFVAVPPQRHHVRGPTDDDADGLELIPMSQVFVAKPGDSARKINWGITFKKVLLLTPGVYELDAPIKVWMPNFIVLGIGFPTLVAKGTDSALVVRPWAWNARVSSVLLEAGYTGASATSPLMQWSSSGGVASDLFSRIGSFKYRGCPQVRADVQVQIDGDSVVVDNTWFWHADHDDCSTQSDKCQSGNGLVVNGKGVTAYGLKVEHMMKDLVLWNGDDGRVFFYQSELPYHDLNFGSQGFVGYKVDYAVSSHQALGLGVYIIGDLHMPAGYRAPPGADMKNMLVWCITGSVKQFDSVVCTSPGTSKCVQGDQCNGNTCYLTSMPGSAASTLQAEVGVPMVV